MALTKKHGWTLIIIGCLVLMAATIPAAIWVTNTQTAKLGNARARCQKGTHETRRVIIQNNQVTPRHTIGQKCDSLVILNKDDQERLMAFGTHEHHISYDGVSERVLGRGQSLTVTLVTSGTFVFHDHENPAVQGTFTVQ